MSRFAVIAVLLGGCFYTEQINQRPSIDISQESSDPVHRGDSIVLDAVASDPDGDEVFFTWHAQACTDATNVSTCGEAFFSWLGPKARIDVPVDFTIGVGQPQPVEALRVVLEAQDEFGATAKPVDVLTLPVIDHPAELKLRKDPRNGYVVDTYVDIYASYFDPDDSLDKVTLQWEVFSPPTQPAYELDPQMSLPVDPEQPKWRQVGRRFTPHGIGDWDIRVTAKDPLQAAAGGTPTVEHITVTVVPDRPPCLSQWTPIAPMQMGQTLPIFDPTLFQVLVVDDDLDGYPTVNDAIHGPTTFRWSLLEPGATARRQLAATGNNVAIDPASYTPGDKLELRVEIEDRLHTAITCNDATPTCSVVPDPQCLQRLTWAVEVQ